MDTEDAFKKINEYINKAKELIKKTDFDIRTRYEDIDKNLVKALKISAKLKYELGAAQSYTYLGHLKCKLSSYDDSLEYYLNALEIYEELNDKEASASIYNDIGNVYLLQENLNQALDNFIKAGEISLSVDSRNILCKALTNCGTTSFKLKNPEEALNYYMKALPICTELGEKEEKCRILSNIGAIYVEFKEFNKAMKYFLDSLKIETELDSTYGIAYANFRIAETYYLMDIYEMAIAFNNKALKAADEIANKPLISYCCVLFSNIYEKSGDYKNALRYFKDYSRIREDVLEEDGKRKIADIKAKFDLYRKEKENEIYKLKNIKLKAVNKKLKKAYENAEYFANIDFLTKIPNRRSIHKYINDDLINMRTPFTIVLCDIDCFKIVNDTYGHDTGDYILVETSTRLNSLLADNSRICRWGGEEFLIVLPGTTLDQGISIAESLRQSISSTPYLFNDKSINITMTFGVCEHNEGDSFYGLIKRADNALYNGKNRGKNCCVSG
ncbi:MAG TPA: diguanylate cyclase [Clostridiales bacterium]|nr:diguanylate cyclase [Clostridiales bacterium]